MSISMTRRALTTFAVASALLVGVLAAASQAQAASLYACVKKNGAARVFTKKPKCKKGESKLSWGAVGPAGRNGANGAGGAGGKDGSSGKDGANGGNGTNGAVAGYFATQKSGLFLTSTLTNLSGLEKTLPSGSYILMASVEIEGFAESAGSGAQEECQLVSSAGPKSVRKWASPFLNVSGQYIAEGDLPLQLAVTTSGPITVTVKCRQTLGIGTGLEVVAHNGTLAAIQTSSIG